MDVVSSHELCYRVACTAVDQEDPNSLGGREGARLVKPALRISSWLFVPFRDAFKVCSMEWRRSEAGSKNSGIGFVATLVHGKFDVLSTSVSEVA